jgi:hypothetical protein
MIFLFIPYLLAVIGIPGLMTIPFYFFNKYLQHKIKPRENGSRLLIYFSAVIAAAFIYMGAGIYLIIWMAKVLK